MKPIKVNLEHLDPWRNQGGIYGIHCSTSNKWYIGSVISQTRGTKRERSFAVRLHEHRRDARKGKHHNIHFQRAWNKYGESAFEFYVIEEVADNNLLLDREQHYLDHFKATDPQFGFNQQPTAGNSTGWKHSETTIEKLRKINAVRTPARQAAAKRLGKILGHRTRTPEEIKKTADALRLSYQEVQQHFSDNGCELLENEYINARLALKYKCVCGNVSMICYDSFRSGSRCKQCKGRRISEKRTKCFLTCNGVTKTLNEWSADTGISYTTLRWRLNRMDESECLQELRHATTLTVDGVTKSIREWSAYTGISYATLTYRKRNGLSDEECIKKPVGADFMSFDEFLPHLADGVPKRKSTLYIRCIRYRQLFREGKLDKDHIETLETIPWWSWDGNLTPPKRTGI